MSVIWQGTEKAGKRVQYARPGLVEEDLKKVEELYVGYERIGVTDNLCNWRYLSK